MNSLKSVLGLLATMILAASTSFFTPAVATSFGTDHSDLWYIPAESGWGIQLVQQQNVIFATLFVYDQANRPTWFVATMAPTGADSSGLSIYSGDVYATTGPWFGTVPFNAAMVAGGVVGSMSFTAQTVDTANLTYTISGVSITKAIVREVLVPENFNGTYLGAIKQQASGNGCFPGSTVIATTVLTTISQGSPATTIAVASGSQALNCSYAGSYSQSGHFGEVRGAYSCANGDFGNFHFFEMANSSQTVRARLDTTSTATSCAATAYLTGLRQ